MNLLQKASIDSMDALGVLADVVLGCCQQVHSAVPELGLSLSPSGSLEPNE